MDDLLFLTQRIPYPPEKGDKIRAWQMLRHLARTNRVHLGCFYDDPADEQHIAFLETVCASVCCRRLDPRAAKLRGIWRLRPGLPLTLGYFYDAALGAWVDATVAAHAPKRIFVFASSMAPYALPHPAASRVFDMVDVDSDKWRQYAGTKPWPMRAIYTREYRTLLAFERKAAAAFDATLLVSRAEADLFRSLAPESASRIKALPNGIDTAFFDPARDYANPYPRGSQAVVFTGAMDYWPNVQAVRWFAEAILPLLRQTHPDLSFWIVGINPARPVLRLAERPGVVVTGRVDDVRPYLRHAAAVVAPLRIARGVQNKVLEAMAMARPVVMTPQASEGLDLAPGLDSLVAGDETAFADAVRAVLAGGHPGLGAAARERVVRDYQWNFAILDGIIGGEALVLAAAG